MACIKIFNVLNKVDTKVLEDKIKCHNFQGTAESNMDLDLLLTLIIKTDLQ